MRGEVDLVPKRVRRIKFVSRGELRLHCAEAGHHLIKVRAGHLISGRPSVLRGPPESERSTDEQPDHGQQRESSSGKRHAKMLARWR